MRALRHQGRLALILAALLLASPAAALERESIRDRALAREGGPSALLVQARAAEKAGDVPRAIALYGEVCETGEALGCLLLGGLFEFGTLPALEKARAAYLRACAGGEGAGCFLAGAMVKRGEGGPKDLARARTLYEQGCAQGHGTSCIDLAVMVAYGEGGPRDAARAEALYDKACLAGHLWIC
jgi:hypothetical protein